MDIAALVRNVYEVVRSDYDGSFNADLIYKRMADRSGMDLTEDMIVQSLDFLQRMRLIEKETTELQQQFKLTNLGLTIPTDLVEKTVRIYMERNMCQDSRVFRA